MSISKSVFLFPFAQWKPLEAHQAQWTVNHNLTTTRRFTIGLSVNNKPRMLVRNLAKKALYQIHIGSLIDTTWCRCVVFLSNLFANTVCFQAVKFAESFRVVKMMKINKALISCVTNSSRIPFEASNRTTKWKFLSLRRYAFSLEPLLEINNMWPS